MNTLAETLASKALGVPVWLWALGLGGGLYWFAHTRRSPAASPSPTSAPIAASAPIMTLHTPSAPHAGAPWGGSNPFSGANTGITQNPSGDANGGGVTYG